MRMFFSSAVNFLRYLWIYFLGGVITPVWLLTSPCQQSLIDQCGRLITGFTPQKYLSGLVPDSAIRDDCEAFASVRLCNDKVLKPCLAAELVTLDPFIRQANEFIMLFCENDQFRRDYAHHGQCLAVVSSDINQCISNYGATVSDIAAMSDNLPPQEVLHRSCCDGLHRLTQCSFDAAVRKCHPSSADFVKKFLYKMMKSTLQDWIARQCFEYQTQCGKDLSMDEPGNRQSAFNVTQSIQLPDPGVVGMAFDGPTTSAPLLTSQNDGILFTGSASTGTRSTSPKTSANPTGALNNNQQDLLAAGTDPILSHTLHPDINQQSTNNFDHANINFRNNITTDDVLPANSLEVPNGSPSSTSSSSPQPDSTSPPKSFSIKTIANDKSKAAARIKNSSIDSHPLARKFLLIISTIAFLAGWY